jgi:hypothetical protein
MFLGMNVILNVKELMSKMYTVQIQFLNINRLSSAMASQPSNWVVLRSMAFGDI